MSKFWELLEQSVLVQGLVTLLLVTACIYLAIAGKEIPELLSSATMLALGFYFGSKSQQTINAYLKRK